MSRQPLAFNILSRVQNFRNLTTPLLFSTSQTHPPHPTSICGLRSALSFQTIFASDFPLLTAPIYTNMIRRLNSSPPPGLRRTSAPPVLPSTPTTRRPRDTIDVMRVEALLNPVDDEHGSRVHHEAATALLELSSGPSKPANLPPSASDQPLLIIASGTPATSILAQFPGAHRDTRNSPLFHSSAAYNTNLPSTASEAGESSSEFAPSPSPLGGGSPLSRTHVENLTLDQDDELLLARGGTLPPSDDIDDGDHGMSSPSRHRHLRSHPLTSAAPPPIETAGNPQNREFTCWVRQEGCATGQYTLDLSRKMVSDYFGRNKAGTRKVQEGRWIRACRKHYQRKSYQDQWRWHKGFVVIQQLRLIAEQQPSPPLRFKVSLKSSEEKRLNLYKGALVDQKRLFDASADEATQIDPDQPDHAPLAVLQEIKEFVNNNGDAEACLGLDECVALVGHAIQMVKSDRCRRLPLFEMMPMFADEGKQGGKAKKAPSSKKGAASQKRKPAGGNGGGGNALKRAKA